MLGIKKSYFRLRRVFARRGGRGGQVERPELKSIHTDEISSTEQESKVEAGLDDTPCNAALAPLVDPTPKRRFRFRFPCQKTARSPIQEPSIHEWGPMTNELDPELLEPGITGSDFTLPLFDGLSTNPADHLIDLDTDSMERCPDVRAYFWSVGEAVIRREEGNVMVSSTPRPTDLELCLEYDDNLVKVGRRHLCESRIRKEGFYISSERDILADNQPGKPWYRLPTIGVVMQLSDRVIEPVESEGTFFDCWTDEWRLGSVYKTNIRVPIIWTELFKQGVAKGTHGWDVSVMARYYYPDHPAWRANSGEYSEIFCERALDVVRGVLFAYTGPDSILPTEFTLAEEILERDFPHLIEELAKDKEEAATVAELGNEPHSGHFDLRLKAITRSLKTIVSPARLRLPCGRRDCKESQGDMTSPRSIAPQVDATTPPLTATDVEAGPSDTTTNYKSVRPTTQESEPIKLAARFLEPGITGCDFNLPLFDGLSTNPADHLIDLDTNSMERCPDVRVYFWTIGERVLKFEKWGYEQPDGFERPTDPEGREEYDNMLVKMGRKHLQESRIKKEGYYVSSERDILAGNQPGKSWYRLPTIGLVMQLQDGLIDPLESEGTFYDCWSDDWQILGVYETNIRVPVIWLEMLKRGVVQGTHGWDVSIMARYYNDNHPAYMVDTMGYSEREVVMGLLLAYTGPDDIFPSDYTLTGHILERDFPHLAKTPEKKKDRDIGKEVELTDRLDSDPFDSGVRALKRVVDMIVSPAQLFCGGRDTSSTNRTDPSTSHPFYLWKRRSARSAQESQPIGLDPDLFKPGVTGVDFDLPLFDGQSTDPADHIIDLDTDSMERCADVRVHFWNVGQQVQSERAWYNDEPEAERPIDPVLRVEYDDMLVKLGREYLKESMRKKEGLFLSRDRDRLDEYLAGNHPGNPWYRLPTVGLVMKLREGVQEGEGSEYPFKDSLFDYNSDKMEAFDIIKTNIRVPMIWIETLRKDIVRGTYGWEIPIFAAYYSDVHPVHRLLREDVTKAEVVGHVLRGPAPTLRSQPCDPILTDQVIARDFAHFAEPVQETMDPKEKARLRAELMAAVSSWDDFFYGKPEFRKKKTFLGFRIR